MPTRLEELGRATAAAARTLANRQAEASGRYTDLLTRFGRGDLPVDKYMGDVTALAIEEGLKSTGAYFSAASKLAERAIIIVGGKPAKAVEDAVRNVAGAAAPARATRARSARKRAPKPTGSA